jgi:transcriptional regulator with XRE-family HTH domain
MLTAPELRELRKRKGWTQERLANEVGVVYSTYQRWESGRQPIRASMENLLRRILQGDQHANR